VSTVKRTQIFARDSI